MKKKIIAALLATIMISSQVNMVAYAQVQADSTNPTVIVPSQTETANNSFAVLANGAGSSVTVNGDVTTTGDQSTAAHAQDGGTIAITGDISTAGKDNSNGVSTWGNGSQVTVGGNVKVSGDGSSGISANGNSSSIVINGNVTVTGNQIPSGGWMAPANGITAGDACNIIVDGTVSATGGSAADASNGAHVVIKGNAVSGVEDYGAVQANNGAVIEISGNVIANGDGNKGVNAWGSNSKVDVDGDVIVKGADYRNTNQGYVTSSDGVNAGDGGTINVQGDVCSYNGNGVVAFQNGTITVGGNVEGAVNWIGQNVGLDGDFFSGVNANDNSSIIVNGNVTGRRWGVNANSNSVILVDGDVKSVIGVGVNVRDGSKVVVKGDVDAGNAEFVTSGVEMDNTSTLLVENGTITPGGEWGSGICIDIFNTSKPGLIIAKEVLTNDESIAIYVSAGHTWNEDDTETVFSPADADALYKLLPEMIFGELEANESGEYVAYAGPTNEAFNKAILKKIDYIVNVNNNVSNGSFSVNGLKKSHGYDVAKAGEELIVTITPGQGFEVDTVSGGKALVTKNNDGTYTVKVVDGGGIDISVVFRAIKVVEAVSASSGFSSAGTNVSNGTTTSVTYGMIQKSAQNVIAQAPKNSTVEIDLQDYISFNRETFEKLSERKDLVYSIIYKYKGKRYRVVIPAGYPIMTLLDDNGYCGCLYLNSIFGSVCLD